MQLRSHAHLEVILNGHMVSGWADDDPPYEWEFEEANEFKTGQDGGLYGLSKPEFGGVLTLKLTPNAESTKWSIQQEQNRKNAIKARRRARIFRGTFRDNGANISLDLSGARSLCSPRGRRRNQTYEAKIRFEEVTSNVDGGIFTRPLVS